MEDEELFNSALDDQPFEQATGQDDTIPDNAVVDGQLRDTQPRDDHGRFAPKAAEPEESPDPAQQQDSRGWVPPHRLREEREAREAAERRIAEVEARWQRQIEQLQRQNQPKPEPAKVPDVFEDPNGFLQHGVSQAIDPIKSEVQQTREYFSRMMAEEKHGADKVQAAFDWIKSGMDRGEPEAVAAYQRAMRSMHPYGELIKAHQQQSVFQQIGSDPQAWFGKTLEERLADPKFAAEVMQKIQGSVRTPQAQPGIVKLPPSIGRVPSSQSASDDAGDMSDASLFAHAMR